MRNLYVVLALFIITACSSVSPSRYNVPAPPSVPIYQTEYTPVSYFVDGNLQNNPCPRYDPMTRNCGGGTELAFNNLSDAFAMAQSGAHISVRGGRYNEQLALTQSGTAGAPIKVSGYRNERPHIVVAERPAIWLINVAHIEISGFDISHSLGWGRLENAFFINIRDNDFSEAIARGTTGGLKVVKSHFNRIENNVFYRGNDSIVIQESDRNIIQGNHLQFARHSLFSIRCSNFNVVRNNYFHNERQKVGEVYDCEGISDAPIKMNATKRNVIEGNRFAHSRGSDRPTKYNGIQYAGQLGLIRNNIFSDLRGGGINFSVYDQEALHNYGNRVVFNHFIDNRCYALSAMAAAGVKVGDNQAIGNGYANNTDCYDNPKHVMRSAILKERDGTEIATERTALPQLWLTRTYAAGAGTRVQVDDVLFFFDGFGIPGEAGDIVQFQDSGRIVQLAGIDHERRELILAQPMQWEADTGVRLSSISALQPYKVGPNPRFSTLVSNVSAR